MSKVFSLLSCHAQMSKGDSKVGGGEPIFRHKIAIIIICVFNKSMSHNGGSTPFLRRPLKAPPVNPRSYIFSVL